MSMKQNNPLQILKYVLFVFEVFTLFFISDTAGVLPEILSAKPALMVCAAIAISLSGIRELPAMCFGVLCGLLMDFSRGGPYGFHALILAVCCYVCSLLVQKLFQKNLLSALMMTVLAILLVFILQWFFFYVCQGFSGAGYALVRYYGMMAAYTLAAAVPVYFLTRLIARIAR